MIELSSEKIDNTVIISISGEISMTTVSVIDKICSPYIKSGLKAVAFDFKLVRFIDSFGISRIIKTSRMFTAENTEFVLINMNDNIKQIFKIATFDRLFTIMTKDEFIDTYINS